MRWTYITGPFPDVCIKSDKTFTKHWSQEISNLLLNHSENFSRNILAVRTSTRGRFDVYCFFTVRLVDVVFILQSNIGPFCFPGIMGQYVWNRV